MQKPTFFSTRERLDNLWRHVIRLGLLRSHAFSFRQWALLSVPVTIKEIAIIMSVFWVFPHSERVSACPRCIQEHYIQTQSGWHLFLWATKTKGFYPLWIPFSLKCVLSSTCPVSRLRSCWIWDFPCESSLVCEPHEDLGWAFSHTFV